MLQKLEKYSLIFAKKLLLKVSFTIAIFAAILGAIFFF
jgi:hypothetical protein